MAVSATTRRLVRKRAGGICEYCHAPEQWQFVRFTIDHVAPQSAGGGDQADNLALACRNCNERRGNRCEAVDSATGETVRIFNPRGDRWGDHFAWDATQVRIVGLTAIGRATGELLDFNDERHGGNILAIRRRDLADGYLPK